MKTGVHDHKPENIHHKLKQENQKKKKKNEQFTLKAEIQSEKLGFAYHKCQKEKKEKKKQLGYKKLILICINKRSKTIKNR